MKATTYLYEMDVKYGKRNTGYYKGHLTYIYRKERNKKIIYGIGLRGNI